MAPLRTLTVLTGVISRFTTPLTFCFCLFGGWVGGGGVGRRPSPIYYQHSHRHLITCELRPVNQTATAPRASSNEKDNFYLLKKKKNGFKVSEYYFKVLKTKK